MLAQERSDKLMKMIVKTFRVTYTHSHSWQDVASLLELWNKSGDCTTPAQLDAFKLEHSNDANQHLLPWAQLRATLQKLPTTLE